MINNFENSINEITTYVIYCSLCNSIIEETCPDRAEQEAINNEWTIKDGEPCCDLHY